MSDWERPAAYKYKGGGAAKRARKEAKKKSDQKGGRSYLNRNKPDMKVVGPHEKVISTESTNPIVVAVDVTGSMARWPYEIFDRLPLLYQTLSQYRPDIEICFAAIGDATCDSYPLQVGDFAKGVELEDQLNALYGEGGGGGGAKESYELFAYYMLHNCRAPNATRPYLIIYGDEGFYGTVDKGQIQYYVGGPAKRGANSQRVWSALAESWNIFHLRKPYHPSHDEEIVGQWASAIGEERIVPLDDPQRAVDLAMGLIARSWGHYGDFQDNMRARQSNAKVREIDRRVDEIGAA